MTAKKLFLASYLQPGARPLLFQASFAKQVLCKQVLANKSWPNKSWPNKALAKKALAKQKGRRKSRRPCFTEA
jgi:hypothetical protein